MVEMLVSPYLVATYYPAYPQLGYKLASYYWYSTMDYISDVMLGG